MLCVLPSEYLKPHLAASTLLSCPHDSSESQKKHHEKPKRGAATNPFPFSIPSQTGRCDVAAGGVGAVRPTPWVPLLSVFHSSATFSFPQLHLIRFPAFLPCDHSNDSSALCDWVTSTVSAAASAAANGAPLSSSAGADDGEKPSLSSPLEASVERMLRQCPQLPSLAMIGMCAGCQRDKKKIVKRRRPVCYATVADPCLLDISPRTNGRRLRR